MKNIENIKGIIELNKIEVVSINGGDKFLHDLGNVAGELVNWLEDWANSWIENSYSG